MHTLSQERPTSAPAKGVGFGGAGPARLRKSTAVALVLAFTAGYAAAPHAEDSRDPSRFTYARLYCGPEGDTHFQDVTAELGKTNFAPPAPPIYIGSDFPASRAFFGGFDASWGARDLESRLNHPTPAVQLGIVLQGVFSITTTDGETRRLPPGSVFRLEDTSPCKGHITVVGDQTGFLMFVRWIELAALWAELLKAAGRVNPTCGVKPGNDGGETVAAILRPFEREPL
jgi:hypothetical protein